MTVRTVWLCAFHGAAILVLSGSTIARGQRVSLEEAAQQSGGWYVSAAGKTLTENILLLQFPSGGWPKNIRISEPLKDGVKAGLARRKDESTIDNGATYSHMRILARAYAVTRDERLRDSFLRGLDYLLAAQYENGGWPQFHPQRVGYSRHITFNDDAMAGVLSLLRDVERDQTPLDLVDQARRERVAAAIVRAVGCILKCQIIVDGRRTAWCAQHDERTLAPAPARAFEPVSLSGAESVGLVRFLMRIEKPSPEVIRAVRDAVAWFERVRLTGIRIETVRTTEGRDRVVVQDPAAPSLWARFYEIGSNRPIFIGRDSVIRYELSEIERERRGGYRYYGDWPLSLIEEEYPAWAARTAKTCESPSAG